MSKKANMCILFRDEVVDVAFVDHSVLGAKIIGLERFPRDENLFEAVAELMKDAGKTPARVTLCVPRGSVMQRTLRYPAAVREDLGNMVEFEATRHVPFAENDRLLGYATADAPDESQVVLNLLAARKAEIRKFVNGFEAAGVPVDETVSFSSLLMPVLSDASTLLVLLDKKHIELCMYGQGMLQDSQLIQRDAPGFSEERVLTAARQMAAKHKAWLGDEGIARILIGGCSTLSDLFEADLGTAFGVHIHRLDLPANLVMLSVESRFWEVLLAASVDLTPTLNLIEDKQRKVPMSKRTLVFVVLGILLSVEVVAAYSLKTAAPALQRRKVALEIEAMKEQTESIQKMQRKNRLLKKQLNRLSHVCESHMSAMEVLQKISDTLPEDTYLQNCSFNSEGLRLKGYSKEPDKLPELIMGLPMVETLSTSDIGKKEDDYHEFTLGVTLRSADDE